MRTKGLEITKQLKISLDQDTLITRILKNMEYEILEGVEGNLQERQLVGLQQVL